MKPFAIVALAVWLTLMSPSHFNSDRPARAPLAVRYEPAPRAGLPVLRAARRAVAMIALGPTQAGPVRARLAPGQAGAPPKGTGMAAPTDLGASPQSTVARTR